MGYRRCIANHWLVGSQHGTAPCSHQFGKWKTSKEDPVRRHTPVHFENLMEEDILNITVKEDSPLGVERLI